MKARVDPDLCTACEVCVDVCPDVFELQGEVSVVLVDEISAELEEAVREAAEACPTDAIILEED